MVDRNKLKSVLEFTYLEALYEVMDVLTMKYRGGWPRLVHLSADYARDSGTTTMCPCGLKARYTVQSCCPSRIRSRYLDNVHTTCEQATCFHDATSAFDHGDNLDGQSDKQGNTQWTGLPSMEDLLIK